MAFNTYPSSVAACAGGSGDWCACAWALATLVGVASSNAWADGPGSSLTDRIGLDGRRTNAGSSLRVTQSMDEPLATAGALSPQDALRGDQIRQTMFWKEHAGTGLGVGFGIEQRGPISGPYSAQGLSQLHQPDANAGMLVGLSLATSARSQLTIQTPLLYASRSSAVMPDDPAVQTDAQRQVRVGLAFNSRKPLADLRQGWRTELNGQTSVAVKMRGGRLGFNLQKNW